MTVQEVDTKCLNRLKKALAQHGPLSMRAARCAMWGGAYDLRDAQRHNVTLQGWIEAGEIQYIQLPDGDGKVGLNEVAL